MMEQVMVGLNGASLDRRFVHEEFMLDLAYGGEVFDEARKQLRELRSAGNGFI